MKAAKIIATCFRPKEIIEKTRLSGNPMGYFYHSQKFTNDDEFINLIKLNIELENKYDPGCNRDLIIVNADVGSVKGNQFIREINNQKIFRGKIIAYTRENFGLSFGSYNDAFQKFKKNYDYFLFTEDDWLIFKDNYFKIGIDMLQNNPKTGMVAYVGVTKIHKSRWKELKLDKNTAYGCHGAIGLSSTKILKQIENKFGHLPHCTKDNYKESIAYGELKFPNSFIQIGYNLVNLPKNLIIGMPAYDYQRGIKYKKIPNFYDLLKDHYFQIFKRKVGKTIWNFVSISEFLKNIYLKFINFIKKK
jgi:hypothetical protein